MEKRQQFDILPQPNDVSCGPTCLHALYTFHGDEVPLRQVIDEVPQVEGGGTLAVFLGSHALRRGYRATLYTTNITLFDPTWFPFHDGPLQLKLRAQIEAKPAAKLQLACRAYIDFLDQGGNILMEDMGGELVGRHLLGGAPILAGLSATYLYQEPREVGPPFRPDDVRGVCSGHFVVLYGYDPRRKTVLVADPLFPNPLAQQGQLYEVALDRLVCALVLGIVTYDGDLLIVQPGEDRQRSRRAERHRGE